MTIGGYAGMVATAPLGALVDATHAKRAIMIGSALTISAASMAILFMPSFPATAASQITTGIAGAAVVPTIAGITFGLVRQAGYAHQLGRNEAFNHAGNVFAAFARRRSRLSLWAPGGLLRFGGDGARRAAPHPRRHRTRQCRPRRRDDGARHRRRLEPRVALLLWIGLTPLMAEACDINTKLMKRTRA
jgi:hypothetical protein